MTRSARERGRRLVRAAAPTVLESVEQVPGLLERVGELERQLGEQRGEVARYQRRLGVLEAEARENRHLQRQVAELTDVVQELLLPVDARDEKRLAEMRQKYSSSL
jgi:predicted RNase H-like nuclease (RuvC/YqgF family)